MTPITVSLAANADELGTTGQTVALVLPDGTVLDLWVFDRPGETTSVDVRYRHCVEDVNGPTYIDVVRTIDLNGTVAVVVR